ncbi:MAG TPA: GNAT family N-acetyltransferase [Candidatus Dorea gallistercoris]|uniref:GNAT family N-acetyltransferase n=1 Tax=Candidatus Dorea gallistercoris TaxID=2838542 RepID=A0A9D1RB40_9FIRM|nr:GNAT family N-acetyltransferase [Candidatus Dorea gallistercoris]
MVREMQEKDHQLYMELSGEFYDSDAVLHPIPVSYREETWKEMMRSDDFVKGYILEKDGVAAGYGLTSYTFSQEAGGRVAWLEELYIRPEYRCHGLGKEFFRYVDERIAPAVKRLRLEIEPDNLRAKKLYLAMGYEELPYVQMVKEVEED